MGDKCNLLQSDTVFSTSWQAGEVRQITNPLDDAHKVKAIY